MNHINKQKKIADTMPIVMLAGVICIILFLTKTVDSEYSEILFLVPGLLAIIIGIIFYFVFKYYAEQFDKIIKENKYIAKWHVDNIEWSNFIEKDYEINQKKSSKMLKYTSLVFIPIVLIACFMMEDYSEMMLFSGIMLGIVLFTAVLVYLVNFQKYNSRKNNSSADIIVTEKALIINSEFYLWSVLGTRFEYIKNIEGENMLQFVYSVASRGGRVNQEINVPIGQAEREQLKKIMDSFSEKIKH